jgi:hypothetical protein
VVAATAWLVPSLRQLDLDTAEPQDDEGEAAAALV